MAAGTPETQSKLEFLSTCGDHGGRRNGESFLRCDPVRKQK